MKKLITHILTLLSLITISAQTTSKMYVVDNSAKFLEGELIDKDVRDSNGEVCAAVVISTDLDGLSFQAYNGIVKTNSNPGRHFIFVSPTERVVEVFKGGYEPLKIILNDYGIRLKSGQVWEIKVTGDKKISDLIPISISSNINEAEVYIDGEPKGTGRIHQLSKGEHEIQIKKDGYRSDSKTVTVSESQADFSFKLNEIDPIGIAISSNPTGAKVFIDNLEEGVTPLPVYKYPKTYKIKVSSLGYLDNEKEISITEGGETKFNFDLIKNSGTLQLTLAPADAQIKLNGQIKTTNILELVPGKYKLEVSKSGYLPQEESFDLEIGATITKSYTLTKNSGTLKLNITPKDAKVLLNKTDFTNKAQIDLAPGRYKVEISKNGYNALSDIIEVTRGVQLEKNYSLIQKTGKLQFTIQPLTAEVRLLRDGKEINSWVGMQYIKDVGVGEYSLECKLNGYTTENKTITIEENRTTEFNVLLKANTVHNKPRTAMQSSKNGTPCPPSVTYSGKTYNTVKIGKQCWFKENLDVGIMISSNSKSDNQKDNGRIEKYCYENKESNCKKYGGLYEWNEAMQYATAEGTQGICPTGWHIPTKVEYGTLQTYVNDEAIKLIDQSQTMDGHTPTNESGFSALFAGYRDYDNGSFYNLSNNTYFWSSTENGSSAYRMYLYYNNSDVYFYNSRKNHGFSVRCLKD